MKRLIIAAALAIGTMGGAVAPANAAIVVVREAPPPPRDEIAPQARRGYVWAPGHWEWRNRRHVWVKGTWVRERRGYYYNAPTWVERNGRWEMRRGTWVRGQRDNDGDGVRNRDDARPNNPNRQ